MKLTTANKDTFINVKNSEWARSLEWVSELGAKKELVSPRILVIDDDPIFCKALKKTGRKMGVEVKACETTAALSLLPKKLPFDIVLIDYSFHNFTGVQLSYLLGNYCPIVMISATERAKIKEVNWPTSIKTFLHKSLGLDSILSSTLTVLSQEEPHFNLKHWERQRKNLGRDQVEWLAWILLLLLGTVIATGFFHKVKRPASLRWDQAPKTDTIGDLQFTPETS
jgi:CheY-like chemotaxis protein